MPTIFIRIYSCEDRLKDKNGRCPGDAGFVSFSKEAPVDFAEFAAAQKAKRDAAKK